MTTNITEEHLRTFNALTSGEAHICDDEPAVSIADFVAASNGVDNTSAAMRLTRSDFLPQCFPPIAIQL